MNIIKDNIESKPGILLDTKYAIEEFNLTWRVANFSQIFDTVHAEFSLKNSSTKWKLRLANKRVIYLCRCDNGEPVNVELKYCLVTRYKTFEGETFHKFLIGNSFQILSMHVYNPNKDGNSLLIEFEKDTLEFFCTIKIIGPALTKIARSDDFLKRNLDKLSEDIRKLLNSNEYSDVVISTGTKKLPVHKAILCARSKVFERMFQTHMLESKNQIVELNDIDFEVIEDFITFLYTGEVRMFSLYRTMNLYYVADKYEVEDLREKCSSYLEFNLCAEEACNILKFSELHCDEKLKKAVTFYIQMHAADVKSTTGWKDLLKNNPLLARDVFK